MNECPVCRLDFRSLTAFDAHRVGKHAYTYLEGLALSPPREDGRRCLDEDEMRAAGWRSDKYGRWRMPPPDEEALLRIGGRSNRR